MKKNRIFKLGDKVAMLNEPISGTIIKISKEQVVILAEDDFEYECNISEIVQNSNLIDLLDEVMSENINPKKTVYPNPGSKVKNNNKSEIFEVDLHIYELVSSEKGMSNFEMLQIQISTAKNNLEMAIRNRQQRIVFIHGIGAGILKNELYKLFKKYPLEYYDASYQKYGQGATEVFIYQNKK
ncbi:MAG: DNA mismatch repair protein MutS [Bacteroidetes bacterium]|nr:MAG: DNA mismatch repair protein MutS [Bacteroidota bacterium]